MDVPLLAWLCYGAAAWLHEVEMTQDQVIARKIVANLAYRYRFARMLANRERTDGYSVLLRERAEAFETEAWNALQVSKRILYGIEK